MSEQPIERIAVMLPVCKCGTVAGNCDVCDTPACNHVRRSAVAWPSRVQKRDWCVKCGTPMPPTPTE